MLRPLYLIRNILGKCLKRFLSALPVVLGIQLHAQISFGLPVYDKAYEILQRVKGLTALSDQDSHISSLHHHRRIVLCLNRNFHFHRIKNLTQEIFRRRLDSYLIDLCRRLCLLLRLCLLRLLRVFRLCRNLDILLFL